MFKIHAILRHVQVKKNVSKKFVLVWKSGGYIVGEDFIIARKYFKAKRLVLGLMKLQRNNKLVYSFKVQGSSDYQPCATINNAGNETINREKAFKHFFYNYLMKNQDEFSIFPLNRK